VTGNNTFDSQLVPGTYGQGSIEAVFIALNDIYARSSVSADPAGIIPLLSVR
jgi:hypothetical protein